MRKYMFALLALAISLFGTQCWAQGCIDNDEINCFKFEPGTTPPHPTHTYNFTDGSSLTVQFDTVLTSFDLRVGVSHPTDSNFPCEVECPSPIPLDPKEFPSGTVCAQYPTNGTGVCDQYDFSGNAGGPHGVPVKGKDYKGLISLTLTYDFFGARNPAFGHAPGDIATFTEDILTSYYQAPVVIGLLTSAQSSASDPTMGGKTPGLSSVVALDEPFTEPATFCSLTLTPTNNSSEQKPQVEVTLKIASASGSCSGTGIRDKTARLSVSTIDSSSGNVVFPPLKKVEANKFHWASKTGLNEYDISIEDLPNGRYTVSVFSSRISPQSTDFCLLNGSVIACTP